MCFQDVKSSEIEDRGEEEKINYGESLESESTTKLSDQNGLTSSTTK